MSKIKNSGLDQYGAELFEQQRFGTAGTEGVKAYGTDCQQKTMQLLNDQWLGYTCIWARMACVWSIETVISFTTLLELDNKHPMDREA